MAAAWPLGRGSTGASWVEDAATQYTPNNRSPCWTSRIGRGSLTAAAVVAVVAAAAVVVVGDAVVAVVGAEAAGASERSAWPAHAATEAVTSNRATSRPASRT